MAEIKAKVASVLDQQLMAFNVGSRDGVKDGNMVVLWRTADLTDPDTHEYLGALRMESLRLSIVHVQESLCVGQITSPAQTEGWTTGLVVGGWEQRKRATTNTDNADGKNLVLVRVGDEATIYSDAAKDIGPA